MFAIVYVDVSFTGTDDNNGANVNQNAEMVLDDATKVRDVGDESRSSHSLPLFTLFVVSSTGNTDNAELKDDGKPITFPGQSLISICGKQVNAIMNTCLCSTTNAV